MGKQRIHRPRWRATCQSDRQLTGLLGAPRRFRGVDGLRRVGWCGGVVAAMRGRFGGCDEKGRGLNHAYPTP